MTAVRRPPPPYLPHGEAGGGSLEVVLVMPVLILLITLVIQFALWSHATHVAVAAAQEGAETARVDGGSAEMGRERAAQFIAQSAPRLILNPQINATRSAEVASVSVEAGVSSLIPFTVLRVRGQAEGIVEAFRGSS